MYNGEPAPYFNYIFRPIFILSIRKLLIKLPTLIHNTLELSTILLQRNNLDISKISILSSRAELLAIPIQYNNSIIIKN